MTPQQADAVARRLIELAEQNTAARERLDDILLESQTNQDPSGEGFATLQNVRDGLDQMRMVVCPDCGYKRCPRASDPHRACTGSNEPGQPGSIY